MRFLALVLSAGLCVGTPEPLMAQGVESPLRGLPVGTLVRFETKELPGMLQRGVLSAQTEPEVLSFVAQDGRELTVSRNSLTRLELMLAKKGNFKKGLLIGVAVGLPVGIAAPVDPENCGVDSGKSCSRGAAIVAFTLGWGLIGGLIGTLIKTERWTPAALDAAIRPGVMSSNGSPVPGLSVTLRF